MDISISPSENIRSEARRLPPGRRESFKLKALRDFTYGLAKARTFDESLRLALMVIQGTYSIVKGALFLDEDGEFRVRASRGLPPGIPPIEPSKDLLATLRRSSRPVCVRQHAVSESIRKVVAAVERAVPAFAVDVLCPLGTQGGTAGFLLLGARLTGEALTVRQRETLGVMTTFLASHISHRRILQDVSSLNSVLQIQVQENARLLAGMEEIFLDTIRALATAIEAKDPYTRGHSERVAKISVAVAKGLDLPEKEVQAIHVASILHDVGKIGTARSILSKPFPLTPEELREIQKHPRISFDILSEIRFPFPDVAVLARDHHEWLDGTGYPDGKRECQISTGARIIALADAFDAMVSTRPYRESLPLLDALGEIRACMRRHYDPDVARIFFRSLRREISGDLPEIPVFPGLQKRCSRAETLVFLDRVLQELEA